ncbi:MAG: hypothetical protein IKH01_11215 [Prevotella sp.]|nr:hypothetical protein [Prevotella sp.]
MENLFNNSLMLNEEVFTAIMQRIKKGTKRRICEPQIIIGAPGSGKTVLLMRLFHAVYSLSSFRPIFLSGLSIFSNADLIPPATKMRCVLFVDDFHYYLKRTSNSEQFELRGLLSKEDSPILVAAVPSMMPQLTDYEAAFFEGFRVYYLNPISDESLKSIIRGTNEDLQRAHLLMNYLPKTPRSATIVREIIRNSEAKEDDLDALIQRMSPLYLAIFDALSPKQQRILCALSGATEGVQLSDLRRETGQDTGMISPYLTQMLERGLISKESKSKRGGFYRISNPLFDLWLQKNVSKITPRNHPDSEAVHSGIKEVNE